MKDARMKRKHTSQAWRKGLKRITYTWFLGPSYYIHALKNIFPLQEIAFLLKKKKSVEQVYVQKIVRCYGEQI